MKTQPKIHYVEEYLAQNSIFKSIVTFSFNRLIGKVISGNITGIKIRRTSPYSYLVLPVLRRAKKYYWDNFKFDLTWEVVAEVTRATIHSQKYVVTLHLVLNNEGKSNFIKEVINAKPRKLSTRSSNDRED